MTCKISNSMRKKIKRIRIGENLPKLCLWDEGEERKNMASLNLWSSSRCTCKRKQGGRRWALALSLGMKKMKLKEICWNLSLSRDEKWKVQNALLWVKWSIWLFERLRGAKSRKVKNGKRRAKREVSNASKIGETEFFEKHSIFS